MKLQWSDDARADLLDAYAYVAMDSPSAAEHVQARLIQAAERVALFPSSGRIGRSPGTRETPVPGTSHVLIYAILAETVVIVRIWHMSREPRG